MVISEFAKDCTDKVIRVSSADYGTLMNSFGELQDAAMLTVSTANGWITYEHIRLDRLLHLFVARSFEDGDYAGAAVDVLTVSLDICSAKESYFITASDEAAKQFYLSLVEQEDMFG